MASPSISAVIVRRPVSTSVRELFVVADVVLAALKIHLFGAFCISRTGPYRDCTVTNRRACRFSLAKGAPVYSKIDEGFSPEILERLRVHLTEVDCSFLRLRQPPRWSGRAALGMRGIAGSRQACNHAASRAVLIDAMLFFNIRPL